MSFIRVEAGWFRAQIWSLSSAGQAPPPEASHWGPVLHPGDTGQVLRVPGVMSGDLETLHAPQRAVGFPVDHASRQVSHPLRGRVSRGE